MLQSLMESGPAILQRSLPQMDFVGSLQDGGLSSGRFEGISGEGLFMKAPCVTLLHRPPTGIMARIPPASQQACHSYGIAEDFVPHSYTMGSTAAATSASDDDFTLTQADFVKAQEGFVPSSLPGVKCKALPPAGWISEV